MNSIEDSQSLISKESRIRSETINSSEIKKQQKTKRHKKQKKTKLEQQNMIIDDYLIANQQGRNVLHRACLEQNSQLINEIIDDYIKIYSQLSYSQQQKYKNIQNYINTEDAFQNTAIILCCLQQNQDSFKNRIQCIRILVSKEARINQRNPRTLWTALHWSAYYLDYQSVSFLLQNGAFACFPDYIGQYPIDMAGISGNVKIKNNNLQKEQNQNARDVIDIIIQNLNYKIQDLEDKENEQLKDLQDIEKKQNVDFNNKQYQLDEEKYLKTPLLKYRLLFWAVYYQIDKNKIEKLCNFQRTYIMYKMQSMQQMTSLHAAAKKCEGKNIYIMEYLLDKINKKQKFNQQQKQLLQGINEKKKVKKQKFNIKENSILCLLEMEKLLYSKTFLKEIKLFGKWERQFLHNQLLIGTYKQYNYLNQKDLYGNTALHLASINGNVEAAELLLKQGADMESENKEGWRPRELIQFDNIKQFYEKKFNNKKVKMIII
ncbi:hypothetical protein IMG5_195040 [Ichthyophthirius multifiliis]|uniref:Uncharacterized protein n=1 Tax=Ichthyophthirius multifiliis TaxID=5932 RepID=G0R4V7_ICHMU|nr:hypothetical protein IMG5_195040 [Ichthyophthirius multifiliis]EGR27500.1 hypothetical protein IMG5_195040 [Ichthyophthirius multifiliis]|eukprot:XP_004024410.1 hypothetical protein IMG5_195040 [Ichthyophthirius multifiliis]